MIGKSKKKSLKQQAREVDSRACCLFCIFYYKLIDSVGVPALRYELIPQIKQAANCKEIFGIG